MTGLVDKRALVSGGSHGIGAAVVRRLVAEGASVAINYHSDGRSAEKFAHELDSGKTRVVALGADLTDPEAVRQLVQDTTDKLGGVDIVVSNAGVEHFAALEDITMDDYDRVFDTNVRAQLLLAQAGAAALPSGGRFVLTSSVSADMAVFRHALYAASKAAVSAMVRNLAPELAQRGIAINAVAPGGTDTNMAAEHGKNYVHPALRDLPPDRLAAINNALGRLAEPEEIAAAVAFLASPEASFITGSTLAVDGGRF